jgi:hypothetical protein
MCDPLVLNSSEEEKLISALPIILIPEKQKK